MRNKIVLEADTSLKDHECRRAIEKLFMDIQKINNRTKIHTMDIREIKKEIKNKNDK